ncbi:MAG: MoxR family ATPase [Chloroflexi bacterium]|nr:MoxR family ATPase [Chloroflexota bacterium]
MVLRQKYELSENGFHAQGSFQERFESLVDHVASIVVTSRRNIRLALLGLFAQGHVLLEDLPGVGKTLLAKTIAASIDGEFSRIQFTPDLLPSDITGTTIFDPQKQSFEFVPGPIFANVVVADELNRTGPRTQSALLEAMAENQVSVDRTVWPLPRPFVIIATQNLVEIHGTYPLPNSLLDRFMVSLTLGIPALDQEMEILRRSMHGLTQVAPLLTCAEVVEMQETTLKVEVAPSVMEYIVRLAAATRETGGVSLGISPRGSASLLRACQCWAAFQGRSFLVPEDVKELAPYVWGHRVQVDLEESGSGRDTISRLLESVPVPL